MPLRLSPSRPAVAALLFVVVAVVMTWPVAAHLPTRLAGDLGDPAFNSWVLAWTSGTMIEAMTGNFGALAQYWHGNIFHPEPLTLTYSEHLTAQAIQILPVYAAGGNILTAYNLLFIATFALSGWTMYLFVRDLTGQPLAAAVAGVAFAYAPYRLGQFPHVQVLSSYWMPLVLLGIHRYFDRGRGRALAGGAAALVLQNLSCGYYLLFFAPFAAAYAIFELVVRRRLGDRRAWVHLILAGAGVALLTLPFVWPYLQLRDIRDLGVRDAGEIAMFSADTHAFASIASTSRLLGEIQAGYVAAEGEGFVGFTIVTLAIVAVAAGTIRAVRTTPWAAMRDWHVLATALAALLAIGAAAVVVVMFIGGAWTTSWRGERVIYRNATTPLAYAALGTILVVALRLTARWRAPTAHVDGLGFFALAAIAAGLLALGPTMHALGRELGAGPYALLLEYLPGFDGLRVPARYLMVVACFLAVLAGLGAACVLRLGGAGRAIAVIAMACMLAESWVAPIDMNQPVLPRSGLVVPPPPASGRRTPQIYQRLRDLPDDVVLVELPFGDEAYDVLATFYAGYHRRALVNGYSGFFPPSFHAHAAALNDPIADPERAAETLRNLGVTHVLLRQGAFVGDTGAHLAAWLTSIGARMVSEDGTDRLFFFQ
jgi:hypothetical protein